MHRGHVRLYRKALFSQIFQNPHLWRLFCWLLLSASHKEYALLVNDTVVTLKPGQVLIGRTALAQELLISVQKLRSGLNNLEKLGVICQKSTNKFTLISIANWDTYQGIAQPENAFLTNEQQTSNKQTTTNNNKEEDDEYLNHHLEPVILPCLKGERYVPAFSDIEEWQATYPQVEVVNALKRMRQWCMSNPARQKSLAEIRRFVTNWLGREQKDIETAAKSGGKQTQAKSRFDPGDYHAGVCDMTEFGL